MGREGSVRLFISSDPRGLGDGVCQTYFEDRICPVSCVDCRRHSSSSYDQVDASFAGATADSLLFIMTLCVSGGRSNMKASRAGAAND